MPGLHFLDIEAEQVFERLPSVLKHACNDCWCFVIGTKSGDQFMCESIAIENSEWISLEPIGKQTPPYCVDAPVSEKVCIIEQRAVSIRIDQIAWAAEGRS